MEAADFWNDPEVSQKKMKELKSMKDDVATYASLTTQFEDIETLIEMGYEENDATLIPEIEEMLTEFTTTYDAIRAKTLLSGEYDGDNAIVSLHAGAGGTESCDWAAMLYRMYTRWADDKGYSVEVLDSLDGEEAGIKSVTFQVNGENAYGYLKSEKGVHRLVRISPFNAAGKIVWNSYAGYSVAVLSLGILLSSGDKSSCHGTFNSFAICFKTSIFISISPDSYFWIVRSDLPRCCANSF